MRVYPRERQNPLDQTIYTSLSSKYKYRRCLKTESQFLGEFVGGIGNWKRVDDVRNHVFILSATCCQRADIDMFRFILPQLCAGFQTNTENPCCQQVSRNCVCTCFLTACARSFLVRPSSLFLLCNFTPNIQLVTSEGRGSHAGLVALACCYCDSVPSPCQRADNCVCTNRKLFLFSMGLGNTSSNCPPSGTCEELRLGDCSCKNSRLSWSNNPFTVGTPPPSLPPPSMLSRIGSPIRRRNVDSGRNEDFGSDCNENGVSRGSKPVKTWPWRERI